MLQIYDLWNSNSDDFCQKCLPLDSKHRHQHSESDLQELLHRQFQFLKVQEIEIKLWKSIQISCFDQGLIDFIFSTIRVFLLFILFFRTGQKCCEICYLEVYFGFTTKMVTVNF